MRKKTLLLALVAWVFLLGQGRATAQETKLAQVQFALRADSWGYVEPFAECSGMGSQSEIIEHQVVSPDGHVVILKIPGRLKRYEITCRRAVTGKSSLWTWRRLIEEENFNAAPVDGEIFLIDLKGTEIARWVFKHGWPASLKISDKDFREELVLTVDDLERVH